MGKPRIHPSVTIDRVLKLCEAEMTTLDNPGICLACGMDADECEPDARRYKCEFCGENQVYGAQEILLSGYHRTEKG